MREPSPEVERVLDQTLDELLQHDYPRSRRAQGLFLLATDLNEYLKSGTPGPSQAFREIYQETRNDQPEWIIDHLNGANLPLGFAESAASGNVELVEFDDPRVDHEFLMIPGDDFFEVIVRQYYHLICGDNSLQSLADATRTDKNLVRDGALLLIGGIGTGGVPWIPFMTLLAWHIVEENVDRVCDEYEPY